MNGLNLLLLAFFLPTISWAFPEVPEIDLDAPLRPIHRMTADYDFNGIVALSSCSASLVRFSGQPDTSQAYVLTNGHCIGGFGGFIKPGEVRYKQPSNRRMNAFIDINNKVRVKANMLVYATMTNTDAALYRLNETYEKTQCQRSRSFRDEHTSPPCPARHTHCLWILARRFCLPGGWICLRAPRGGLGYERFHSLLPHWL